MNKPPKRIRCAIYTRKSTEEGLEQEFNSLDAQRESAEAFIKSQAHEGWVCLPAKYDDGGFTGGNMERPALRQLLADIESGQVDCVIVYKVDRLSRSLLDFARMMEIFDRKGISFVSVTQQFNTTHSMGRLTLNILLSFAQFEREIISERTRDKIAATRRKGKWSGGRPILGYDADPVTNKLIINHEEAPRVRAIFRLYAEHGSLLPVAQELNQRGWRNKLYNTRKGISKGGMEFTRTSLWNLLTNPLYFGQVRHKDNVYAGEHEAIIDEVLWQRVQTQLERNGIHGGREIKNRHGSILKGLLRCVPCGCAMTPSYCCKNGKVQYRYYTCTKAQKQGWEKCSSKSVPAGQMEQFVVERIRGIGSDPALQAEVLTIIHQHHEEHRQTMQSEQALLMRELKRWQQEARNLIGQVKAGEVNTLVTSRLAEVQERIAHETPRLAQIREELERLADWTITAESVATVLGRFDELWKAMNIVEKQKLLQLLIDRIDYDGKVGQVTIHFHPTGLESLLTETITENAA
ncbi:MAG: recombinase family protein [Planctomycetia bacterium]|nr:recombinase family protein [Planctomycetia bacterium]